MSKSKAAAERGVKATTSRHINLLWPPLIWVIMWVVAEGTYLLFHYVLPEYLPWVVLFASLALVGLCYAVFRMAMSRVVDRRDPRAVRGVIYAAGTAVASSFWVLFGMIGNPMSPGLMVFWGFGIFVVIMWVIRMVMERTDAQAHANGQPSRRGAGQALLETVTGDPNLTAEITRSDPDMIELAIDLTDSDLTQAGLREAREKLAAAVGRPQHAGVIIPNPHHAGLATARILLRDIMKDPIPWPGPTNPGGTPFSVIEKGVYITGDKVQFTVADGDGVRQKCTVGMPRVGKGNGALIELGNAMTWQETTLIVVDVRKGFQTVEPIVEALDWVIVDKDDARAMLTAAIDRLLEGRFRRLAAMNPPRKVWEPGCGMQFVWIQVEEASYLDLPDSYIEDVGKSAGSAGVHIDWSLQSSIHTQMSTTLRRMFSVWAVYGCQDGFEIGNLPDELAEAGVNPAKWRDEHPGMNYLSAKGIPRDVQATDARDYLPDYDMLRALARKYGSQPLDQYSADLLGPLYLHRMRPVDMLNLERDRAQGLAPKPSRTGPRPSSPAQGRRDDDVAPMNVGAVATLEREDEDPKDDPVWRMSKEDLGVVTPCEGGSMDLNYQTAMEMPLRPGENVRIGDPDDTPADPNYRPDEESVAWMRQAVDELVETWYGQGTRWVRPADFVETDLCGDLGPRTRGRTWFNKECERLAGVGRLQRDETTGKYLIIPKAAPDAGM